MDPGQILWTAHFPPYLKTIFSSDNRAHEIAIRTSFVRPSSVRLWHRLPLKLLHGFFQILVFASPGPYTQILFLIFEKKIFFYKYFSFSFPWDPIGAKISKR